MPACYYALGVIAAPLPFVGYSTMARRSIKVIMAKKSMCFSLTEYTITQYYIHTYLVSIVHFYATR